MTTAITVLVLAGVVLLLLMAWGTVTRNSMGINLRSVTCPRCIRRQPRLQRRRALRQLIFGGGTCPECRTLFDQWGREIMPGRSFRSSPKRGLNR